MGVFGLLDVGFGLVLLHTVLGLSGFCLMMLECLRDYMLLITCWLLCVYWSFVYL